MRVFCLCNGQLGYGVIDVIQKSGDDIVGLALHPPERCRMGKEILDQVGLPPEQVFNGSRLHEQEVRQAIARLEPEIGVSALFGYILREPFLSIFPHGVVNLHTSYLPYNRGAHPNVWSIVDQTPAGATLHYIDAGVDTGDIIAQTRLDVDPTDTGQSLYSKLEGCAASLFRDTWPAVRLGQAPRTPQQHECATSHRTADLRLLDEIDLDARVRAADLLNILRARTFPPHRGAYFRVGNRRIHVRVELCEDTGEES